MGTSSSSVFASLNYSINLKLIRHMGGGGRKTAHTQKKENTAMSYQPIFLYPPRETTRSSGGSGVTHNSVTPRRTQPLRVTSDGIEPLLFALVHSIEFCFSVGRSGAQVQVFTPQVVVSNVLGGIQYVSCPTHSASLVESLAKAVAVAHKIEIPHSAQYVNFVLRVRVFRVVSTKALMGFLTSQQKQVIVGWEFKISKTKTEVLHDVAPPSSSSVFARSVSPSSASGTRESHNSISSPPERYSVYSNDPAEIRKALHFIAQQACTSIDAEWYRDLRAGELIYEVDVQEK